MKILLNWVGDSLTLVSASMYFFIIFEDVPCVNKWHDHGCHRTVHKDTHPEDCEKFRKEIAEVENNGYVVIIHLNIYNCGTPQI